VRKIETSRLSERDPALEARLAKELGDTLRGEVRAFARVPSTMDVAHALAAQGAAEGTLIWAQQQEQGRGRQGRAWESPAGGAYFSIIVRPARTAAETPQLALVAGLAAAEAVRECAMLSPRVRWPNDLLLEDKKVAGILVETKSYSATSARSGLWALGSGQLPPAPSPQPGAKLGFEVGTVVIGVGINVATKPSDLPETATSLAAAGGKSLDPLHLTARLYRRFLRWYDVWSVEGFAPVREALRPQMAMFGEVVHIIAGNNRFEGTASDLDEAGRLIVRLDSGMMRAFEMGEVTLLRN